MSSKGKIRLKLPGAVIGGTPYYPEVTISGADPGTVVMVKLSVAETDGLVMKPATRKIRVFIDSDGKGGETFKALRFSGEGEAVIAARATNLTSGSVAIEVV